MCAGASIIGSLVLLWDSVLMADGDDSSMAESLVVPRGTVVSKPFTQSKLPSSSSIGSGTEASGWKAWLKGDVGVSWANWGDPPK